MSIRSFDARHFPLDGLQLIEASAGTGKTFSLAGLYLRLVLEKRLGVDQILVITFTRAATQELRERIRARLVEAARIAARPASPEAVGAEAAFAENIIATATAIESRAQIARRLAEAALRMDEAAITTIHGFTQRAAADNAFDSALPFDRGEQVDDGPLFDEVIADYWRAGAIGAQAHACFVDCWDSPAKLARDLAALRSRAHTQLLGPGEQQVKEQTRALREAWPSQGPAFVQTLQQIWDAGFLNKKNLKPALMEYEDIQTAINELEQAINQDDDIIALPRWTRHLRQPEVEFSARKQTEGTAFFDLPLARMLCSLQPLWKLTALRRAQSAVTHMAAQRKRERRQFSFADMISALAQAVHDQTNGPSLCQALHAAWPWALVDEFQDTDPLQYSILRQIYSKREHGGLILIGDPKQAIYGFRGGDVLAYLQAATHAGDNRYGLDRNYRSTAALIHAVETLFRTPGSDAFLVDGIHYQQVSAGRADKRYLRLEKAEIPPISFWHLAAQSSNKEAAESACQNACVARIQQLLDPTRRARIFRQPPDGKVCDRAVAPRDIAVLVNTNQQAAAMQRALARAGIAAVCVHQQSVFASSQAQDVLLVLQAAAHATDESLIRGALASGLMGSRLADLIALQDDETGWQAQIDRFQQAQQIWRQRGLLAMLQPLIQAAAPRLLGYDDGERRLSNYLQLAELLAQAESESFGPQGLLRWLREAMLRAQDGQGRDSEQLRLESDEALVRVTTVHKAKGLEYPLLFLPFAPWLGSQGQPAKPPHHFHDQDNQSLLDLIGNADNQARAVTEARAEGLRLLYVALTRAEIAVFLPWVAANGTPNSALASLLHRQDGITPALWAARNTASPLTAELTRQRLDALAARSDGSIQVMPLPDCAKITRTTDDQLPADGRARRDLPQPSLPWSVFSFTRLVRAAGAEPAAAGAEDEQIGPPQPLATEAAGALPDLPGGAAYGSAIHALLETADPALWHPGQAISAEQRSLTAAALRRYGIALPPGRAGHQTVEGSVNLIRNTLHTPLPGLGSLAAIPAASRLAEMEFMFSLEAGEMGAFQTLAAQAGFGHSLSHAQAGLCLRGLMHGFIDLVVEHEGRYYVIDYKTNWLGNNPEAYAPGRLQPVMQVHHYDLQYLIYLVALHRYLSRRLPGYKPAEQLGGAMYLFVRGLAPQAGDRGVFQDRPEPALIEQIDALFGTAGAGA